MSSVNQDEDRQVYLPDFCAATTLLLVILIAELLAITLTLSSRHVPGTFMTELANMSMFVLLLALPGVALLCRLAPWLSRMEPVRAFVAAYFALLSLFFFVSESIWQLTGRGGDSLIVDDTHARFILRTMAVGAIVLALALRYLYINSEWRRSIVLEAQARISALQALMRPHFLFNSMNTIAALTRSDPRQAEIAVEDLADLLRANLGAQKDKNSVEDEIELATIYERIEKLRLGDRLNVRWNVEQLPPQALVPSLTIQPLLENAIYHGIETLPEGGVIDVTGARVGDRVVIAVSNPLSDQPSARSKGNRMAMSNIRQRYELAYGGKASVEVHQRDDRFSVTLSFPLEGVAA